MSGWRTAPISQGFGPTNEPLDGPYNGAAHFNKGFDYSVPIGTAIDAAVGGTVLAAGDQGDGWGNSVKVRDAQGNVHNYGHLGSVSVRPGQTIATGTIVGKSGNSGKSTGPHLSYDVADSTGRYIDPSPFVGGGTSVAQPASGGFDVASSIQQDITHWQQRLTELEAQVPDPKDPKYAGDNTGFYLAALKEWNNSIHDAAGLIATYTARYNSIKNDPNNPTIQSGINQQNADTAGRNADTSATNTAISAAQQAINRNLSGLGESGRRATLIQNSQDQLGKYGLPEGKTSFTYDELGGGFNQMARLLGLTPQDKALSYPGQMRIDPQGDLARYDKQFGVGGELPPAYGAGSDTGGYTPSATPPPPSLDAPAAGLPTPPNVPPMNPQGDPLDPSNVGDRRLQPGLVSAGFGGTPAGVQTPPAWEPPDYAALFKRLTGSF